MNHVYECRHDHYKGHTLGNEVYSKNFFPMNCTSMQQLEANHAFTAQDKALTMMMSTLIRFVQFALAASAPLLLMQN